MKNASTLLTLPIALLSGLWLTGCCSSGATVRLHTLAQHTTGPALIVYHPDHATWDTAFLQATIEVDGEPVGALCEGQLLVVPLPPGSYLLSTSRDRESGCSMSPLRPPDGWPAVEVVLTDGLVFVRYGSDRYDGPDTDASVCDRHLVQVDGATARREAPRAQRVGG